MACQLPLAFWRTSLTKSLCICAALPGQTEFLQKAHHWKATGMLVPRPCESDAIEFNRPHDNHQAAIVFVMVIGLRFTHGSPSLRHQGLGGFQNWYHKPCKLNQTKPGRRFQQ